MSKPSSAERRATLPTSRRIDVALRDPEAVAAAVDRPRCGGPPVRVLPIGGSHIPSRMPSWRTPTTTLRATTLPRPFSMRDPLAAPMNAVAGDHIPAAGTDLDGRQHHLREAIPQHLIAVCFEQDPEVAIAPRRVALDEVPRASPRCACRAERCGGTSSGRSAGGASRIRPGRPLRDRSCRCPRCRGWCSATNRRSHSRRTGSATRRAPRADCRARRRGATPTANPRSDPLRTVTPSMAVIEDPPCRTGCRRGQRGTGLPSPEIVCPFRSRVMLSAPITRPLLRHPGEIAVERRVDRDRVAAAEGSSLRQSTATRRRRQRKGEHTDGQPYSSHLGILPRAS